MRSEFPTKCAVAGKHTNATRNAFFPLVSFAYIFFSKKNRITSRKLRQKTRTTICTLFSGSLRGIPPKIDKLFIRNIRSLEISRKRRAHLNVDRRGWMRMLGALCTGYMSMECCFAKFSTRLCLSVAFTLF